MCPHPRWGAAGHLYIARSSVSSHPPAALHSCVMPAYRLSRFRQVIVFRCGKRWRQPQRVVTVRMRLGGVHAEAVQRGLISRRWRGTGRSGRGSGMYWEELVAAKVANLDTGAHVTCARVRRSLPGCEEKDVESRCRVKSKSRHQQKRLAEIHGEKQMKFDEMSTRSALECSSHRAQKAPCVQIEQTIFQAERRWYHNKPHLKSLPLTSASCSRHCPPR